MTPWTVNRLWSLDNIVKLNIFHRIQLESRKFNLIYSTFFFLLILIKTHWFTCLIRLAKSLRLVKTIHTRTRALFHSTLELPTKTKKKLCTKLNIWMTLLFLLSNCIYVSFLLYTKFWSLQLAIGKTGVLVSWLWSSLNMGFSLAMAVIRWRVGDLGGDA